jgi:hypothetical protein
VLTTLSKAHQWSLLFAAWLTEIYGAGSAAPFCVSHHTDITRDAALYRSLARAAISSSREATNPCGLQAERRLLLSLSPHVVVPDALEKEQQHERALLAQQQREDAMHHHKQQQHAQLAQLPEQPEQQQPQQELAPLSVSMPADAAATPASPTADSDRQQEAAEADVTEAADAEPEFTDPLRRRTFPGEGALLSDEEEEQQQHAVVLADDAAELVPARVQPLWLQGMQLYDRCAWRAVWACSGICLGAGLQLLAVATSDSC